MVAVNESRWKNLLEQTLPTAFSYDHNRGLFLLGLVEYSPEKLPHSWDLAAMEDVSKAEVDDLIQHQPLVSTKLAPVMLPRMYDWLQVNLSSDLLSGTKDIMRDVYVRIRPDMGRHLQRKYDGFMGFDVGLLREEHPHLILDTLGNCACLGVDVDGAFGEHYWDQKVASFSFHNLDTNEQRVSLLAGLGHIAHQAMTVAS